MTPERYEQINELLDLVSKLEPNQRSAYLNRACAGDEALRREIESLLAAEAQANRGGFLEVPAAAKFAEVLVSDQSPKAMPDKPMILNGRYLIERELSEQGGIGIVYLAHDLNVHRRPVVVKLLKQGIGQSDYWKRKIHGEIEALARFQNPHIVGIIDAGELPDHNPFFVMAYVEGVNLRVVMKDEHMEFARVACLVRQIGQALSYAHDRFVHHRDLKPANIMLRVEENAEFIILIDFGIATVKESQPATRGASTAITGTPPYMAPEQIQGEPSEKSDIWALGVIAYEMLCGRRPFVVSREEPLNKQLEQLYTMQQAGVKWPKDLRCVLSASLHDLI